MEFTQNSIIYSLYFQIHVMIYEGAGNGEQPLPHIHMQMCSKVPRVKKYDFLKNLTEVLYKQPKVALDS